VVPDAFALREILFASDLSPASDLAFDHARLLAQKFGARLVLFHTVQTLPTDRSAAGTAARDRLERERRTARSHLEMRAAALDVDSEVVVEAAPDPAQALLRRLEGHRPDLLVMATHGRQGLAHLIVGSVAEAVLARRACPVLCIRPREHGVALPYRRLLLPTDLSHESRRAFPVAALLAAGFGAEVIALHVAQVPEPSSLARVPDLVESRVPDEASLRTVLKPDLAGAKVAPRIVAGEPWERILETARTENVDLIVISTHGHDSLADRVMGSHADRVVRQAPCPVLVV
jgi:nucleotide-binding universal stress UspA family protein